MNKITENYLELAPAYGRDYKSAALVTTDFLNGKDFKMMSVGHGDGYCSVRDFAPGVKVNLRYKRLASVAVVEIP